MKNTHQINPPLAPVQASLALEYRKKQGKG